MPRVRTCTGVSRVYFPSRDASVRALLFALRGLGVVLYERQIVLVPWDFLPRFTLPRLIPSTPGERCAKRLEFKGTDRSLIVYRKGFEFIG